MQQQAPANAKKHKGNGVNPKHPSAPDSLAFSKLEVEPGQLHPCASLLPRASSTPEPDQVVSFWLALIRLCYDQVGFTNDQVVAV